MYFDSAVYSKKSNLVLGFEKYGKDLKFYSPDLKLKEKLRIPLKVEGFILGIDFSDN